MSDPIKGKLMFHSETGTEGGWWGIQDETTIRKVPPRWGLFADHDVWDQEDPERHGRTTAAWHQDGRALGDPMNYDQDYYASSLFRGQDAGDRDADQRLMERWGFTFEYIEDKPGYVKGGTPRSPRPYGVGQSDITVVLVQWDDGAEEYRASDTLLGLMYDYEGLHLLKNGDRLKVYFPNGEVYFDGEIQLRKVGLFTEDAGGMWLNQGPQEGFTNLEWAVPFLQEWDGELVRNGS